MKRDVRAMEGGEMMKVRGGGGGEAGGMDKNSVEDKLCGERRSEGKADGLVSVSEDDMVSFGENRLI